MASDGWIDDAYIKTHAYMFMGFTHRTMRTHASRHKTKNHDHTVS